MKKPEFKIGDVVIFKNINYYIEGDYHQGKVIGAYYLDKWFYHLEISDFLNDLKKFITKEEKELTKIT